MKIFDAPVRARGLSWVPLAQFVTWGAMTWVAGRRTPARRLSEKVGVGAGSMAVLLGSEWCHNLAHAAVASHLGKPVDSIRILLGMPRLIYNDLHDPRVTPREHIVRALGGPLINALLLPVAVLFRRKTLPGSAAREVADIAVGTNAFLCTGSLLPIPWIDGGPILKWALVESGRSVRDADETVRKANGALAAGLGVAAVVAHKKRRRLLPGIMALFSVTAFAVAAGVLKESELPWSD